MLSHMLLNFLQNRNTVFFAINNLCNCKCEMCSIWNSNNKKIVNFKSAKKALIKLKENNFGYLQITGGEPLLNPNLFKIIFFAKKIGFVVSLTTNGTLIDEITAKKLAETKIDNISISFHHYDEKIFESISNHKNILDKVTKAIKLLKRENIFVIALFTISKYNKYDIEKTGFSLISKV